VGGWLCLDSIQFDSFTIQFDTVLWKESGLDGFLKQPRGMLWTFFDFFYFFSNERNEMTRSIG
jgi:hypothetical protein